MDPAYENFLHNIANANMLFRHLLDRGHTASGSMESVEAAAEELHWNVPRATDAAYVLHSRQWLEVHPPEAFDGPASRPRSNGARDVPVLYMRLSLQGFQHAERELATRAHSKELARLEGEAKRAQRWVGIALVLLGFSVLLNFLFWLRIV